MYLNKSKLQRAKDVVEGRGKYTPESVEKKALAICQAESLKGEDLIKCVYVKIGGALADAPHQKETRTGVIDEVTEGKEVEEVGKGKRKRARKSDD